MGENSKIEWCDHTFNPWEGCTKVSPGCANCYAAARDARWHAGAHWGLGATRRRTEPANWKKPLKWQRDYLKRSVPELTAHLRIFCASLADWLDPEVPTQWRHDLLDLIDQTSRLDWLLLTKRPHNWRELVTACAINGSALAERWLAGAPPGQVHFGVTVEDNARAHQRLPFLRGVPAAWYFVSHEPSLELVDWTGFEFIDQLIVGGESGPGARPMHPENARAAEDWCAKNDVSFFFKQWGDWLPEKQENGREAAARAHAIHIFPDGLKTFRVGKICAGRQLDGVIYDQLPVPF